MPCRGRTSAAVLAPPLAREAALADPEGGTLAENLAAE